MAFNFKGQSDVFDNGSSGDNSEDLMFDIENPKRSELSIQHPRSNVHQDNDSHGLLIEQPFKIGSSAQFILCDMIPVQNIVGSPLSVGSTFGLEEKLDTIQKLLEQQQQLQQQHFHDCIQFKMMF
ncbi:uncharacterized protein LOC132283076 isoform X2 [Cornus florida]|uniref:uncharacterized protein LOC132283076 isoform X2 n=1 Tax=Cornus florida TaxID=4283 RepID=UPI00289EA6C8|nr:uncharacterized protein LOC132283076 isoform X2 [Cornus florida]